MECTRKHKLAGIEFRAWSLH